MNEGAEINAYRQGNQTQQIDPPLTVSEIEDD
jgi:hypothetical protein